MNSRERVFAALEGNQVDRVPVICPTSVANVSSMEFSKSYFPYAHHNVDKMVALSETSHTVFGFDSVMPYFSIILEAAALGCQINWGAKDTMPTITTNLVKDIDSYTVPRTFLSQQEVVNLFKAIAKLKKIVGKKCVVIGKAIGPWTLAYHLYGAANVLLDCILNENSLQNFLLQLSEITIKMVEYQLDSGADLVTWADHPTADLVSPKLYKKLLQPIHKSSLEKLGCSDKIILHVCGNIHGNISNFIESGFKIIHVDSRNNIEMLHKKITPNCKIVGGVSNPLLLNASTSLVRDEVGKLIDTDVDMIAPECGIPPRVPSENLREIVYTTKRFGTRFSDKK